MRCLPAIAPLLLLSLGLVFAWALGWNGARLWHWLAANEGEARRWVAAHPVLVPVAYAVCYVVAAALCIPNAALLSITGGVLLGPVVAALCIVPGATTGATILFLVARTTFGAALRQRAEPWLRRIGPELERDGFNYLLLLRLLPIAPFWLVNLAPALVGMRVVPFVTATAIGIIPGVLLLVSIGAGIGAVLDAGNAPDVWSILTPHLIAGRVGLALLAFLPVLWRRWRRG